MIILLFALTSLCSVTACRRLTEPRPPQPSDHVLCKVQLFKQVDDIQESQDPRAVAEAYYNRSGQPCKTYCRIRSRAGILMMPTIFDSPEYIPCGIDRYCSKGKCKRIGSPEAAEDSAKTGIDKAKEGQSPPNMATTPSSISSAPAVTTAAAATTPQPALQPTAGQITTPRSKVSTKAPAKVKTKAPEKDGEEDKEEK